MARWLDGWVVGGAMALVVTFALILVYPEVGDETWERMQRTGVLRVGMDASFPPFAVVDSQGQFSGFDVDLARELGRRLGVDVPLVNVAFDGLYDGLRSGKYDAIISALPYDPRLTQDVAYSHVYFNAGHVLVVRQAESTIRGIRNLGGRAVAVEWGSSGDLAARKLARRMDFRLSLYRTPQEALQAVAEGQTDAAIVDAVSALESVTAGGGVKIVGDLLTNEPYVIAVPRESPKLLRAVNEALVELREDGFLAHLEAIWF